MTHRFSKILARTRLSARIALTLLIGAAIGALLYAGLRPASHGQAGDHSSPAGEAQAQTIWTCAMHPEVRLPEPGLCPKCGMALIPEEKAAGGVDAMRVFTTTAEAKALMNIQTAVVERRVPAALIRMVGKVSYDETMVSYITAWVGGRLDRLFVDYTGVPVRKGDHMVEIYSPELFSAQEELLQAKDAVASLDRSDVGIIRKTATATVDAAREKLRRLGLGDQQVAQIERRGKADDHVVINAPVSGIVVHKNAEEGTYVQTGTRIYALADLSNVWVQLDAYESDLSWLRYGQDVQLTSVAYPGETFTGTISFIDPLLNPTTRTVKVRVNVPNPDGRLKPDMFVNGVVRSRLSAGGRVMDPDLAGKWISPMHPEVVKDGPGECDVCGMPLVKAESLGYVSAEVAEAEAPLVIPVSAALVTGTRAIVYVEKPDADEPTYEGREIVLGPRAGEFYLVRRGLAQGERVVSRGNFKIDSALQIKAQPSMMTPDGGAASSGHNHGGDAHAQMPERKDATASGLFRQQVAGVLAAARQAHKAAEQGEVTAGREAFAALGDAVEQVDAGAADEHARMLWKEAAMRLGNDAFEGARAETPRDMERVSRSLNENVAFVRERLGLAHDKPVSSGPTVPHAFQQQLGGLFEAYFVATDALAGDDATAAAKALKQMAAALGEVDAEGLNEPLSEAWKAHAAALEKILAGAEGPADLKAQRELLALLSEETASLAREFPPARSDAYYLLRCSMAFDGRGAVWLAPSKQVRNPYYGSAMLGCGEVEEMMHGKDTAPIDSGRGGEHDHDE
jgi:Cu(I)/Ag(I) efflux system membrane fusion protein